jgi:hypothetical protein
MDLHMSNPLMDTLKCMLGVIAVTLFLLSSMAAPVGAADARKAPPKTGGEKAFVKVDPDERKPSGGVVGDILQNGTFESGQSYWTGLSFNGSYYSTDTSIITNTAGAYKGSWYAKMNKEQWLYSNTYIVPANISELYLSHFYKYTYSGSSCNTGYNGANLWIYDWNTGEYHYIDAFYPSNEASSNGYAFGYYQALNAAAYAGHTISIEYLSYKDAAGCTMSMSFDNVKLDGVVGQAGYNYDGVAYYVSIPPNTSNRTAVHRFSRKDGFGHFYTASNDEMQAVMKMTSTFSYDGVAFYVYTPPNSTGKTPVYRFSRKDGYGHFYTASAEEYNWVYNYRKDAFVYDGVAYYVDIPPNTAGKVAVYRSSRRDGFGHFYTASADENASVNPGWQPSSVASGEANPVSVTPSPTMTVMPTRTMQPTVTPVATGSATIAPTEAPTATPEATPTAAPTATPDVEATPTAAPTAQPTAMPTEAPALD